MALPQEAPPADTSAVLRDFFVLIYLMFKVRHFGGGDIIWPNWDFRNRLMYNNTLLSEKNCSPTKIGKTQLVVLLHVIVKKMIHRRSPQKPSIYATPLLIPTSRLWNSVLYPPDMASPTIIPKVLSKPSKPTNITVQKTIPPSWLRTITPPIVFWETSKNQSPTYKIITPYRNSGNLPSARLQVHSHILILRRYMEYLRHTPGG